MRKHLARIVCFVFGHSALESSGHFDFCHRGCGASTCQDAHYGRVDGTWSYR